MQLDIDGIIKHQRSARNRTACLAVTVFIFSVVFIALGVVGQGDYEEAVAEEARYCQRVELGVHRDFNENINCKKESNDEH